MKPVFKLWIVLGTLACLSLLTGLVGCGSGVTTAVSTTPAPAATTTTTDSTVVLNLIKDTQNVTFTMETLKALPTVTGYAGQMSSTGTISGPFQYKGVALSELLKSVGGVKETNGIRVSAKDGYAMTLSYKQLTEGNFTILDSNTGKEVAAAKQPVVFIAYEEDGKPIAENIGPLRLGIMTAENQVTEGHWWIKWTQKIEITSVQAPWNLKLEGAITENMDQSTFESGAAIGCHGNKYTDDTNQVWEGIPLWYLIGRIDDATDTHKGDAFSDTIADAGYEVQVISADGYTAKFTSAETKRNNNMLVAFKLDSKPLTDKAWPLKLVGSGVDKKRQVGGIASIKLVFGTSPASPSATASISAGPVILTVINGTQTKTFSLAELKAQPELTGFAGTKNKTGTIAGPFAYKGVDLMKLLSCVGGLTEGKSVKFTAKDGYSKTITYNQISTGDFSVYDASGNAAIAEMKPAVFMAYEKEGAALDEATGPVQLGVMTCKNQVTDGSWWVKQIEKVEIISQ
jgi:hypothetical protein